MWTTCGGYAQKLCGDCLFVLFSDVASPRHGAEIMRLAGMGRVKPTRRCHIDRDGHRCTDRDRDVPRLLMYNRHLDARHSWTSKPTNGSCRLETQDDNVRWLVTPGRRCVEAGSSWSWIMSLDGAAHEFHSVMETTVSQRVQVRRTRWGTKPISNR